MLPISLRKKTNQNSMEIINRKSKQKSTITNSSSTPISISKETIITTVNKLKTKKASGPDKQTTKTPSNPLNYRHIALINCIGKILERIVNKNYSNYIEENRIINAEKAGFRSNKNTQDKIFQLTQIAFQAKNRKHFCASLFMDVKKAFDKVWHKGLIYTLIQ